MGNKNKVSREELIKALSAFIGTSPMNRDQAHKKGMCCKCGGDAKKFKDSSSASEYSMTGWCQTCQDDFYGD